MMNTIKTVLKVTCYGCSAVTRNLCLVNKKKTNQIILFVKGIFKNSMLHN